MTLAKFPRWEISSFLCFFPMVIPCKGPFDQPPRARVTAFADAFLHLDRKNNSDRVEFLMYDGDFFVPIVRLDLLERDGIPLPNTWEEALAIAKSAWASAVGLAHWARRSQLGPTHNRR